MPDPHPLTVIPAKAPITPGARFVLSFPSETLPEWVTICPWGTEGWLLAAVDDVPGLRDEDCRVRLPGAPAASVVRHGPWVVIPEAKLRAAQSLTPLDPQTTERVVGMFQELCAGMAPRTPGGEEAQRDPELQAHLRALVRDAEALAAACGGRAVTPADVQKRPGAPAPNRRRSASTRWISVGGLALAAGLAGLLWLRTPSFTRELPGLYMARAHPGEAGVELVDVHGPCRAAGFPGHRPCDGATTDLRYRLDPQSNLRFMSIWAADGTHALSQFGPLEPTATGGVERCERGLCPLPNAVRAVLQGVRRAQVVLSEEPAGSRSLRELNAATGLVTFSFEFTEIK